MASSFSSSSSSSVPGDLAALASGTLGSSSVYPQNAHANAGTKRPYAGAFEYALENTERLLTRRPAASSMPFPIGRAFQPSIFGTPAYASSGDSLDASSLSETTFAAVMARPDKGAFATPLDTYELVWSCVTDSREYDPGFTTTASLQKLNALLELSSAAYENETNVQRRVYGSQLVRTATEFGRTFRLLGPATDLPERLRASMASTYVGPQESLVPYAVNGRALVHNIFGTQVRPGDTAYVVASAVPNPYSSFLLPSGGVLALRSATGFGPERLLQLRGATDRELGTVAPISSRRAFEPADDDAWYVRNGARIAQMTKEVEYDEFTDNIRIRNVAAQEGLQEALAGASEVVVSLIEAPHVMSVGLVLRNTGADASEHELKLAHRVRASAMALGQVEVLLNIG